ncbi:MAG: hypothetical protein ACTH8P_07235 [Ewingella sp.]|jgi:hypothetical protein|uniref:hypothetical protein n=1 Tax=Ewingella TaxID=41201 RepID=UPI0018228A19|nr:DUF3757 domain-containing protein [Pseudomonas reactans]
MNKTIILSVFIGLTSFAGIAAAAEQCPKPETVVATKQEEDSDKVMSMVYCSPSADDCKWKGYDPMAEKGSEVETLLNPNGEPTKNNGLTYCDYKLKTGDQIRMTLSK